MIHYMMYIVICIYYVHTYPHTVMPQHTSDSDLTILGTHRGLASKNCFSTGHLLGLLIRVSLVSHDFTP